MHGTIAKATIWDEERPNTQKKETKPANTLLSRRTKTKKSEEWTAAECVLWEQQKILKQKTPQARTHVSVWKRLHTIACVHSEYTRSMLKMNRTKGERTNTNEKKKKKRETCDQIDNNNNNSNNSPCDWEPYASLWLFFANKKHPQQNWIDEIDLFTS